MLAVELWMPKPSIAQDVVNAEERKASVEHCQDSAPELTGSIGWRICTNRYLENLKRQQLLLLKNLKSELRGKSDEGVDTNLVEKYVLDSQRHWERYVRSHCDAAQAAFGKGNSSGDVMPSCLVAQYEIRNYQLKQILIGNYEH